MNDAHRAAVRAVKRFFFAVSVQDGAAVWEVLGDRARAYVLNLAVQQGMDFELGSRLRNGTATDEEQGEYLANLVAGIRRDLDGLELSNLIHEVEDADEGRIRVRYLVPLGLSVPGRGGDVAAAGPPASSTESSRPAPAIPAGSVLLALETGAWKVDRLIPRPGQ